MPHQFATSNDDPVAFFITWTVFGSWLQGDLRGWRKRRSGDQLPLPLLADWHRKRLKYPVLFLDVDQRAAVETECRRHCEIRRWHVWAINARSSHIHAVIGAPGVNGARVRDQLKANGTRVLRESWSQFSDRPVWTAGGDWQAIDTETDVDAAVQYVNEAQDRKSLDNKGDPLAALPATGR